MESDTLEAKESWLSDLRANYPAVVDIEAHLVVLRAIANSSKPGAPQRAEALLFHSLSASDQTDACYEAVLEAWSKSSKEDSSLCVIRAQRWFNKIQEPTLHSYHLLLDVISKGCTKLNNRERNRELRTEHARTAEKIIESMTVPPDTIAYNYVLRAWSKVSDPDVSSHEIFELLGKMEQMQQENPTGSIQPNTKSYAIAIHACAILAEYRAKKDRQNGGLAEVEHMEELLRYMHKLRADGFPDITPNTVVYNTLISVHARISVYRADTPLKAEKVLRRMVALDNDSRPDHISFTKVILAWANAKRETSGRRAEYWLEKLWDYYETNDQREDLRPTVETYNTVLRAWQNDPQSMETVFLKLIHAEKADNNSNLRPNSQSFAYVIHAWTKVDISRAVMWLGELMRREEASTAEWSVTTVPDFFQGIIKYAAQDPSLDNLTLGLKVFDYYKSSRHPMDPNTYARILELGLSAFSMPECDDHRRDFILDIFQSCCEDGLVSGAFIKKLSNEPVYSEGWTIEASEEMVEELFHEWPLPMSWSRNVPAEQIAKKLDLQRTNFDFN